MTGSAKDWIKKSPQQICQSDLMHSIPPVDLTGIQLAIAERESELPHSSRAGVSGTLSFPQELTVEAPILLKEAIDDLLLGERAPMTQSVRPETGKLIKLLINILCNIIIWNKS